MGFGDFMKDVGDGVAHGLRSTVNTLNHLDPFHAVHYDSSSSAAPTVTDRPATSYVSPVLNPIGHQVEWASQQLRWLYSNGVSQPISTALLTSEMKGHFFSAHNWATAWHAANHISPGQAFFLDPKQTQKAVDSPLEYYKPGDAQLPPDFNSWDQVTQQDFLKKAGMPVVGNAYIDELRHTNSTFKNASGVADFALTWFGSPDIVAGKVLSKERMLRRVARPQAAKGVFGVGRRESGWSAQDINKIMDSSGMSRAQQFIWDNKDNPQLLNNLSMARSSGMGPRFGAIASMLKTPDEVHDFLRVGLGDVDAIERLQMKNALASSRIEQETSRVAQLDLMATRYADLGTGRGAQYSALAKQAMEQGQARVNADEQLVTRYNQVLDQAHQLDQVNVNRWSFAKAQARTADEANYRSGVARGMKARQTTGAPESMRRVSVTPTPLIFSHGTSTPVDLGLVKNRIYGVGDFFSTPVTMVRSLSNFRPNGYMRIDDIDRDSINELRGHLARIPGISDQTRLNMLNDYLKTTTEAQRTSLLKQVGATGAAKVAEKHGFDPEAGLEIYQKHLKRQVGEKDDLKRYSAATKPIQLPDGTLARVKVDEFMANGGKLSVHPNLVTRLANDHVFQDLDEMDRVLARHGSALKALRTSSFGNTDWMVTGADYLSSMWKFGTLFRLGYIPRVASDDLAGQVARLGAATMAMRAGWGVRNGITNVALWHRPAFYAAQHATAMEGVKFADEELAHLRSQVSTLNRRIKAETQVRGTDVIRAQARVDRAQARVDGLTGDMPQARRTAAGNYLQAKKNELERAQTREGSPTWPRRQRQLQRHQEHIEGLEVDRAKAQAKADEAAKGFQPVRQGNQPVKLPGGVKGPSAFGGNNGQYYYKQISSDEMLGQLFLTNKQLIHGHLMRSFDHGAKAISPAQDEALHATSWAHAINAQIMQDPLAIRAVKGASVEDMTKWLKSTAEGRRYQRRLGLNPDKHPDDAQSIIRDPEELANAAWHDVAEYMPRPEIRAKALEPGGVDPAFLKKSMPVAQRPDVHTGQVGGGAKSYYRAMDKVMAGWYKFAATLPADRLSRHPLFNQLYEGHMKTLAGQLKKQGAYDTTVGGLEDMATNARKLALRDTRKLVFDIAHRSDAAAALRFISPFMAATTESFQRWGRIIAEKPQTVGYAANFYNSGMGIGSMQDADGNSITKDGYSYTIDPKTGKAIKRLVPKSERYIVGRMPKWLVHNTGGKRSPLALAFGIEPSSRNFRLSQNSADLVTQGDPWFNPGVGPIVQIPVNHFVKDKPKAAELARHLQILPFGPQTSGPLGKGVAGEVAGFVLPTTVKNFLTAYDTSDSRYQAVKMQILQRAAYEHDQLHKPMPSAKQIADMTRNYWLFSAGSAFLQPMATSKQDNYQFFRDQYNALERASPETADDEFLSRYGESYFIFAASQSKNVSGAQATTKAVELSKKYGDLIAKNPELGSLIIGPEGNGPFSPEAYAYQLNTPVTPGSAEMQRTKMSADQALEENQRRLGWSKYTKVMSGLNATLQKRGLKSFNDKGAEDLKQEKSNYTNLYSQPLYPDGTPNPYYNEAWSKDFATYDTLKYDRLVPGLTAVANSPLARESNRSDLRVLQEYLGGRKAVLEALGQRQAAGLPHTLAAQANADLAGQWQHFVDGLIESDTRFGDLHSRYLSRDLNYDNSQQEEA